MNLLDSFKTIKFLLLFIVYSSNALALEFSTEEKDFSLQYLSDVIQGEKPKDYVVATLIASQLEETTLLEKLYVQGNALNIDDKLWLDMVTKKCLMSDKSMSCDPFRFIRKLKKIADENALPHVYAAIYRARNNEMVEAYEELKEASQKQVYDDYYWKRFLVLLETLRERNYPNEYLYTASVKFSHNMVTQPYQNLMDLCERQSRLSLDWKNTCIKLGVLLEKKGTIFFANMVGFALQREALSLDEMDSNRLAKVKEDREQLNQWRINAVEKLDFIEAQKQGPDSYYHDLVNLGEKKAIENALLIYRKSLEKHN